MNLIDFFPIGLVYVTFRDRLRLHGHGQAIKTSLEDLQTSQLVGVLELLLKRPSLTAYDSVKESSNECISSTNRVDDFIRALTRLPSLHAGPYFFFLLVPPLLNTGSTFRAPCAYQYRTGIPLACGLVLRHGLIMFTRVTYSGSANEGMPEDLCMIVPTVRQLSYTSSK